MKVLGETMKSFYLMRLGIKSKTLKIRSIQVQNSFLRIAFLVPLSLILMGMFLYLDANSANFMLIANPCCMCIGFFTMTATYISLTSKNSNIIKMIEHLQSTVDWRKIFNSNQSNFESILFLS